MARWTPWRWRAAGAAGGAIPGMDIPTMAILKKMKASPKKTWAKQGFKVGGPAMWGYSGYQFYKWDKKQRKQRTSRFYAKKSRGKAPVSRSYQRKRKGSTSPSAKLRTRGPKTLRRRGKRCPHGYRYNARRNMCVRVKR